jgi:hypothetical protein
MSISRALISCIVVASLVALTSDSAWAAGGPGPGSGTGTGSLGPTGIGASAVVSADGGPATATYTPVAPNPPPAQQSGYSYETQGNNAALVCLDNGTMVPYNLSPTGLLVTPSGTNPLGPVFAPTVYQLYGPNGQPVGSPKNVCPSVASNVIASPTPPPPPPPPSPADVWAVTPLPTSAFHFNPGTLGLTQLPTWFWLTGLGGQVAAMATIRGYRVVTTAHPVGFYWSFGDGGSASGRSSGSEANPSVTHTYVTKGGYRVAVIVGWSGQYTFSGNGIPSETVPLGTVDGPAATASYGVQEVRSVEVAEPSG